MSKVFEYFEEQKRYKGMDVSDYDDMRYHEDQDIKAMKKADEKRKKYRK